ncbi:MAG TPA: PEP-CTERM sorting domain-containing protein [Rhizomicrobium sp.]|nr:PEP-CTERM sorting domain-containing protein [Rhizomicrobium sp.]HWC63690.1 PEP-CTERM sorting domain-containing protein [Rhizomicrobium sp.]
MKWRLAASAAAIALAAMLPGGAALASVIPVESGITPDGSFFKFTYDGQLAPDQGVTAGDKLVIIDFAGYVAGSVGTSLSNVTASTSPTLPAGMLLDPGFTDNPTIPDLVFTYTGPDFHTSGGPYPTQFDFTGLYADSIYSAFTTGSFSAVAVKNDGELTGSTAYNVGEVAVPTSAVPEPGVWAMMLAGLFGIGMALRSARKASGATLAA